MCLRHCITYCWLKWRFNLNFKQHYESSWPNVMWKRAIDLFKLIFSLLQCFTMTWVHLVNFVTTSHRIDCKAQVIIFTYHIVFIKVNIKFPVRLRKSCTVTLLTRFFDGSRNLRINITQYIIPFNIWNYILDGIKSMYAPHYIMKQLLI